MTSGTLIARIVPASGFAGRRARHLVERNFMVYRRAWMIVLSGFFEPVFYLFSIGIGIGQLVGDVAGPGGQPISYATFVAPALLASSAMNGAIYESTMNIFFKMKFSKIYDAILATPMGPLDIAIGEISWSLLRGALYAVAFLIVVTTMGLVQSAWGILAIPAALLIGFAFGAVGMAATTYMRTWQDFDLIQLVTLPLFLFSATFYPLDVYPRTMQIITQFSPLYHGTVLIRGLMLGDVSVGLLGHVLFLVVMGLAGTAVAGRRLQTLLLK